MARSEIISNINIKNDDELDERKRRTLAKVNRSDKSVNTKKAGEYMSDPNTIKFTNAMVDKMFSTTKIGRPYAFESVERLNEDVREYIQLCYDTNTIPTITTAATWLDCNRDTLYAHANNSNSPFSDTCKKIVDLCHFALENGAIGGKVNAVLFMFLGKNYFGLKDDKNITVTPATNNSNLDTQSTMDAIQKQIEEETVINADFQEE